MIGIKDWWPALGAPVVAFIVGIYHKVVVIPGIQSVANRIDCVEERTDNLEEKNTVFIADIAEIKTDLKWIRNVLDRNLNGKKR